VRQTRELQAAANALGLEVVPLEIRRADDIPSAFAALNAQADALYIVQDALIVARTARLSLRVDTLISIRFMAHRPSQSSACAALQVGSATSWPS